MKHIMRSVRRRIKAPARLWQRWLGAAQKKETVTLHSMHRRLELLIAAMYGRTIPVREATVEPPSGWLRQVRRVIWASRRERAGTASSDGVCIYLPREITGVNDVRDAQARYRLLALEHAERITRGVSQLLPPADSPDAQLTHDLYLLAEGSAVDNAIAKSAPGMRPLLESARTSSLTQRPRRSRLTPAEQDMEQMLRGILSTDLDSGPRSSLQHTEISPPPHCATPADSLEWARDAAARLLARTSSSQVRYNGLPDVQHWGSVAPWTGELEQQNTAPTLSTAEVAKDSRIPRTKPAPRRPPTPSSPEAGQIMGQVADRNAPPSEEHSLGEGGPSDALESDGGAVESPDSSGLDESTNTGNGAEAASNRAEERSASHSTSRDDPTAAHMTYDEWDYNLDAYRRRAVTVVMRAPAESDSTWAAKMLAERSTFVRQIRQHFERLRAQRVRLVRQQDGDELDLAACVGALVDWRMGRLPDDRLYARVRPARQPIAIALLVDVSGSTNAASEKRADDAQHVIDVEKLSLLFASEALDALGDKYAIMSFAGRGASGVRVATLKDFSEPNGDSVRRRISAITAEGNTRLGAAIRHATAVLANQAAAHRLLLILSDGKPSDTDRYFEEYGAEDSRLSILEARTAGVFPFCLAIESDEVPAYLPRIFGTNGYIALSAPDELPEALLRMLRQLLGSS